MESHALISGKYELRRRLGEGGMAEVWAVTNVLTHRDFAIKLILPALAGNAEAVERFFQEAKAAGRLRHPSIVDVFDVGRTRDGRPYLVMELLSGESLESRLRRDKRIEPVTASVWIARAARGLALAHRAGVVHRDLSAANLFLALDHEGGEPTPKILDFGVSKIVTPGLDARVRTGSGAVLGSPEYMSPEQACGAENVDSRSDVWALGVLLYQCLSGITPFRANNYNALMLAILSTPHRSLSELVPGLDAELVRTVESCLVKDREARTQSALELAEELERVARRMAKSSVIPGAPRRRALDRIPASASRPVPPLPAAARLPARAFPVGVRCWQFLTRRAPPSGLMAGGALGGTAFGLAIGVAVASSRPPEPRSVETPPALSMPEAPTPSSPPPALAAPAARVAEAEVDLVRATARGLGVSAKAAPKPAEASRLAERSAPPRRNPY